MIYCYCCIVFRFFYRKLSFIGDVCSVSFVFFNPFQKFLLQETLFRQTKCILLGVNVCLLSQDA